MEIFFIVFFFAIPCKTKRKPNNGKPAGILIQLAFFCQNQFDYYSVRNNCILFIFFHSSNTYYVYYLKCSICVPYIEIFFLKYSLNEFYKFEFLYDIRKLFFSSKLSHRFLKCAPHRRPDDSGLKIYMIIIKYIFPNYPLKLFYTFLSKKLKKKVISCIKGAVRRWIRW